MLRFTSRIWLPPFAIFLVFASYTGPTLSCGFHDPTLVAQGMLNHMYPKALYIVGAIQRARQAGRLPKFSQSRLQATSEERKILERIAFEKTMSALHALGIEIERRTEQGLQPGISLVVLNTMLWTRFSSEYFDVRQGLHVKGPVAGDVVLVTDEPVILSIQEGSMSIDRALELGVMRIYAAEQQSDVLLDRLGSIGETPLSHPDLLTSGYGGLFDSSPTGGSQ